MKNGKKGKDDDISAEIENQTARTEALTSAIEEAYSNGHKPKTPIQIEDGERVRYVEPDIKYRFLPVQLTKAEVDVKHNELIEAMDALDQVEREFEEVKKEFKTKIQARENRIEEVRNVIKSGFERRDVECVQRFNYDKLTVEDLRSDTKEVVATRAMTQKERQHNLFEAEKEETATVEV